MPDGGESNEVIVRTPMNHSYIRLAVMAVLSFVSMYVLMYAMVDRFDNVFHSLNQAYMAGLMAAPMVVIEILLMGSMYGNRRLNAALIVVSVLAAFALFLLIRQQTAIADRQFLRSMIPHHAGAILMCEEAPLKDTEVRKLCASIIASQRAEIAQMKALLAR
jgi:small-conductance mechanosensitive channel